jgi:hypothetical protein
MCFFVFVAFLFWVLVFPLFDGAGQVSGPVCHLLLCEGAFLGWLVNEFSQVMKQAESWIENNGCTDFAVCFGSAMCGDTVRRGCVVVVVGSRVDATRMLSPYPSTFFSLLQPEAQKLCSLIPGVSGEWVSLCANLVNGACSVLSKYIGQGVSAPNELCAVFKLCPPSANALPAPATRRDALIINKFTSFLSFQSRVYGTSQWSD